MKKSKLQKLPLGTSAFGPLRDAGQIYVDKTEYVYELASTRGKFFLSRPRRFGKSLLVSTFESLFKYGLTKFHGLAIEELWDEEKTYQVVRIDFSETRGFSDFSSFLERLNIVLAYAFGRAGFVFDSCSGIPVELQLSDWFKSLQDNSLVLLIDEYDAPLNDCLDDNPLFGQVRRKLSSFYSTVKSNDDPLRFLFVTGITKFNKTSIFSELNNLVDISLNPDYAAFLGYTRAEVEQSFGGYLEKACRVLNLSREALLSELTRRYDGFCFDRNASVHVFSPWSLLNFFNAISSGFLNYWFESGGKPSVLTRYIKTHALKNPETYGALKTISLSTLAASSDVETLSDIGLLFQTGYLTIRRVIGSIAVLDYPNAEVRSSMAQIFIERFSGGKTVELAGVDDVARRMATEPVEKIVELFGRMFGLIDYQNYAVRDEASVRAFVQVYLAGAGLDPKVEVHNGLGRSDLEVEAGERLWVFEFKVKRGRENEEALLSEAVEQMKKRRYGEERANSELLRVALVFSIDERRFVRWAVCP